MDFVGDALSSGRRVKVLTVVDDFSKESVDLAALFRGYPKAIRPAGPSRMSLAVQTKGFY